MFPTQRFSRAGATAEQLATLETDYADRAYTILASLVTPRPIALVTTVSADGKTTSEEAVSQFGTPEIE